jgi:hypothetical protein
MDRQQYLELRELSDDELIKRGLFHDFLIQEANEMFIPIDDYYDEPIGDWPRYFDESVRNNLPAWRESFLDLNGKEMDHIMENHTLVGSIGDLLDSNSYSLGIIAKKFDLNPKKVREDIPRKIKAGASLSKVEEAFIDDFIGCDKRNYFPRQMSRQQIHKAIREAYGDAQKISVRQNPSRRDLDVSNDQRSYGSAMYSGIGAGLTIHFWYNFTDAVIETAYPWFSKKGSCVAT